MTNSVGSADTKVAAKQVVSNILWQGLVASGHHPDSGDSEHFKYFSSQFDDWTIEP